MKVVIPSLCQDTGGEPLRGHGPFTESLEPKCSDPPLRNGRDIGLREATEMAITRTLGAIPHHGWVVLLPLVLVGNVVVASLAWWLVGSMLK
jgi:hypothetical protein